MTDKEFDYHCGLQRMYNPPAGIKDPESFERGLRDSLIANPVEETKFRIVKIESVNFHELQQRRDQPNAVLLECTKCQAIANQADCTPNANGARECPLCQSPMLLIDDNYIDQELPFRACDHCQHQFLWDDALGGAEPGTYICPQCHKTT